MLLHEGRNVLDAVDAADRRTRRVGRAEVARLGSALVTTAGLSAGLPAELLDAYAAEPEAVAVDVVLTGCPSGEAGQTGSSHAHTARRSPLES